MRNYPNCWNKRLCWGNDNAGFDKNKKVMRDQQPQHYHAIQLIGTMNKDTLPLPSLEHETMLNALTDCPACRRVFKDPVTLPCGYTLCYECIPTSEFQCPSFSCLRMHKLVDKRINMVLKHLLEGTDETDQLLSCPVCLQRLQDPITTACGHTFCKECLITSQFKSCPLCRQELLRIGKVDGVLSRWVAQDETEPPEDIPVIEILNSPPIPLNQDCLFRIAQQSAFDDMIHYPYQPHYAICMSDAPVLLKITHVEYTLDLRHSVVQAHSLRTLDQPL